MRRTGPHRACPLALALALAACGSAATDEPEPEQPEDVKVYATDTSEGACLAAVAEHAAGATLQVIAPGGDVVGVTADGALWTCRIRADGSVAALLSPGSRR